MSDAAAIKQAQADEDSNSDDHGPTLPLLKSALDRVRVEFESLIRTERAELGAPLKTHPLHLLSAAQENSPLLAWKPSPLKSNHMPHASSAS
jgi:hypothetical protein